MRYKLLSAHRALAISCLITFAGLGLAGCQSLRPAPLTITVPSSLRSPCPHPDPVGVMTVGDLASFSIRQAAAISVCSSRGDALVSIIDGVNVKPKRGWWPW